MNVFAIESPCDDAFYGFQSFAICSSFDIVSGGRRKNSVVKIK